MVYQANYLGNPPSRFTLEIFETKFPCLWEKMEAERTHILYGNIRGEKTYFGHIDKRLFILSPYMSIHDLEMLDRYPLLIDYNDNLSQDIDDIKTECYRLIPPRI